MSAARFVIGWKEWITLPELDVHAIKAKVDTGAKTSSLHAYAIETVTERGQPWVKFEVHPLQGRHDIRVITAAPLLEWRTVVSSSGEKERRPVIMTVMQLGSEGWQIELNLTNRDYMGHRMLLGREAMAGHTMIQPGAEYVWGRMTNAVAAKKYR